MVTESEARDLVRDRLRGLISDHGATVELGPVEGGWRALVTLPPERGPLLGLGEVFVTRAGVVVEYPSSYSPRMALEAFATRDDTDG